MYDGGAERQAEKSERSLSVGGGTAEGRGTVRQADTARDGHVGEEALAPEPQVLPVNRRIGNGTSGGVGGRGREAPPYPILLAAGPGVPNVRNSAVAAPVLALPRDFSLARGSSVWYNTTTG